MTKFVFVVDSENRPLMPTTPARAARFIKTKQATYFWKKGLFCIRLNKEPSARHTQDVAIGVDPGSKREAFTVKSEAHTYVSVQTSAVTWVKGKMEFRSNLRKNRRSRKTPYRQNKINKTKNYGLPPSTKARWGLKLRIIQWLNKLCPIACFVVEDIKAVTRPNQRRWNVNFSPLQIGKNWFYLELKKLGQVVLRAGYETSDDRKSLGFPKEINKLSNGFYTHCVDSWILANHWTGGHTQIDNFHRVILSPWQAHRRQLHVANPSRGNIRKSYGSTRSLGFRRMSLVSHPKHGLTFVGGNAKNKISLHRLQDNLRVTQKANIKDLIFKSYYPWNYFHLKNEKMPDASQPKSYLQPEALNT